MEIYKNNKYRVTLTAEKNKPNDDNEKKKMNHQLIKILSRINNNEVKIIKNEDSLMNELSKFQNNNNNSFKLDFKIERK